MKKLSYENPSTSNPLKRYPLVFFFVFAYGIAWIPLIFQGTLWESVFFVISAFGPAIAAIIVAGVSEGQEGIQALVSKLFIWRVNFKWYLVALLAPVFLEFLAILIHRMFESTTSTISFTDWIRMLPAQLPGLAIFLLLFVFVSSGEELGWRGYALPRLQSRYGSIWASLILGLLWGFWHLPTFWMPGSSQYGLPILGYILATIGFTFIYTCIYNGTKESVLLTSLYHAANNLTLTYGNAIFPEILNNLYLSLPALAILVIIVIFISGSGGFVGKQHF